MRKLPRNARAKSRSVPVRGKRAESLAFTEWIIRGKQRLRRYIADNPQLKRDFDFLIGKTGWRSEFLLARLFWDQNIMHSEPRSFIAQMNREAWPVARKDLERIVKNALALAKQIERVNETKFSPTQTLILRNESGEWVGRRRERELQAGFATLPEILRIYAGEVRRKVLIRVRSSRSQTENWLAIGNEMRATSLFELVRSATGQYHATRLLRLVNAARNVVGFSPIGERAFVIWLNRLRKSHSAVTEASPLGKPVRSLTPRTVHLICQF